MSTAASYAIVAVLAVTLLTTVAGLVRQLLHGYKAAAVAVAAVYLAHRYL